MSYVYIKAIILLVVSIGPLLLFLAIYNHYDSTGVCLKQRRLYIVWLYKCGYYQSDTLLVLAVQEYKKKNNTFSIYRVSEYSIKFLIGTALLR